LLKHRLISFVVLLTILWVIATQSCGPAVFAVMAAFLTGMAVFEGVRMAEKLELPGFPRLAGAAAALATLAVVCRISTRAMVFVPAVILLLLTVAVWVAILCRRDGAFRKLVCSIGLALPMWISFSAVFLTVHRGLATVVFLICCTKAMDTGGYIFGMLSARMLPGGNHKIAPSISPKKSWEGFCGGLLLSLIAGWLFCRYQVVQMHMGFALAAAGLLSVGSFFGDLTESALKRAAGIKDSGSWLPGMGGALDLLDSFIYNGILFFILTMLFRL